MENICKLHGSVECPYECSKQWEKSTNNLAVNAGVIAALPSDWLDENGRLMEAPDLSIAVVRALQLYRLMGSMYSCDTASEVTGGYPCLLSMANEIAAVVAEPRLRRCESLLRKFCSWVTATVYACDKLVKISNHPNPRQLVAGHIRGPEAVTAVRLVLDLLFGVGEDVTAIQRTDKALDDAITAVELPDADTVNRLRSAVLRWSEWAERNPRSGYWDFLDILRQNADPPDAAPPGAFAAFVLARQGTVVSGDLWTTHALTAIATHALTAKAGKEVETTPGPSLFSREERLWLRPYIMKGAQGDIWVGPTLDYVFTECKPVSYGGDSVELMGGVQQMEVRCEDLARVRFGPKPHVKAIDTHGMLWIDRLGYGGEPVAAQVFRTLKLAAVSGGPWHTESMSFRLQKLRDAMNRAMVSGADVTNGVLSTPAVVECYVRSGGLWREFCTELQQRLLEDIPATCLMINGQEKKRLLQMAGPRANGFPRTWYEDGKGWKNCLHTNLARGRNTKLLRSVPLTGSIDMLWRREHAPGGGTEWPLKSDWA